MRVGVDRIVEVGGPNTMKQSLAAIAMGGEISVVGFLGGARVVQEPPPSLFDTLKKFCTVRGVAVGSRVEFEKMNQFIEKHRIKPVLDKQPFKYSQVIDAYKYMIEQKHFGKVVIQVKE